MGRRRDLERDQPCSRSLGEQFADPSGAIRRADHARDAVHRLDLLDDAQLDAYRARHPDQAAEALNAHELLLEAMDLRTAELEEAARRALEDRVLARPILTVVVCLSCGAFEVARSSRRWDLDRAMRRTGIPERDLLGVALLLAEAWAEIAEPPPRFDDLSSEQIRELLALLGHDLDHDSLRVRYRTPPVRSARTAGAG